MNTSTNTVPPAVREDVVSTLTEAEVHAWLGRRLIHAKKNGLPKLGKIEIGAKHYSYRDLDEPVEFTVYGYGCSDFGDAIGIHDQPDLDALFAAMAEAYSGQTAEGVAAKKRAAAAALLAEADKLCPPAQPVAVETGVAS